MDSNAFSLHQLDRARAEAEEALESNDRLKAEIDRLLQIIAKCDKCRKLVDSER
jgi:hypothetical protein